MAAVVVKELSSRNGPISRRVSAVGKDALEPGENRFLADCPHNSETDTPLNKEEQRRNRLNFIPHAQIGIVIGVHLDHLRAPRTRGRHFVQGRLEDMAGATPRRPKRHHNRWLRLQHLRLEVRLTDVNRQRFAWPHVHIFDCTPSVQLPGQSACQETNELHKPFRRSLQRFFARHPRRVEKSNVRKLVQRASRPPLYHRAPNHAAVPPGSARLPSRPRHPHNPRSKVRPGTNREPCSAATSMPLAPDPPIIDKGGDKGANKGSGRSDTGMGLPSHRRTDPAGDICMEQEGPVPL